VNAVAPGFTDMTGCQSDEIAKYIPLSMGEVEEVAGW